ncbi:MAG: DUF2125 domain-containing protein [Acuticoccus sp.]
MAKRSRTLRYKLLMIGVLIVVVGWTVGWFMIATVVDRHAEKAMQAAEKSGTVMDCVDRSVKGFPFRIEVRCAGGSRVGNADTVLTVNGLTAAALIYKPSRLIVEAQGPVALTTAGLPPVMADWALAHASARIALGGPALKRIDVEVKDGTLAIDGAAPIPFDELDINVRENPAGNGDLDIAVALAELAPLPEVAPLTLVVQGRLADGAALLSAPDVTLAALAAEGFRFVVDTASAQNANGAIAASGELTLGADGLLNGTVDLALTGADLPLVNVLAPPQAQKTLATLLPNILAFAPATTIGDRPAKKLTLTVKNNAVAVGVVPLFKLAPVNMNELPQALMAGKRR